MSLMCNYSLIFFQLEKHMLLIKLNKCTKIYVL